MHTDDLEKLKLGELYQEACEVLCCAPVEELTEAFNSANPKQALISLILERRALASNSNLVKSNVHSTSAGAENTLRIEEGLDAETQQAADDEHILQPVTKTDEQLEESVTRELDRIWCYAAASRSYPKVAQWLHAIAQMSLHDGCLPYVEKAQSQLCQALDEHGKQASEWQTERRTVRVVPPGHLDPLVKSKLEIPGMTLSPEDSRHCLVSCIEHGKVQSKNAEGKHVIIVLGNTGAGKSAFINLLHGCTFELDREDRMVVRHDSIVPELMKIGHTNKSETFSPQLEDAVASFGAGYAFADCPGFLDNRGFEINVANAVNVKQTIAAAASVFTVVIINYHSLLADRGKGVKDLFHILSGLFGNIENVKKHANSLLLAISQAPVVHPETGHTMTLDQHKRKLLDPSGLDEMATELLDAIGDANVVIYHLLERGDATWLKREAIIARIKGLLPIVEPHSLFQAAINDGDKESLRTLVERLADKVKVAIGAAEYDIAVDAVCDLLELKVVENDFVMTIVDKVIQDVADEQLATVRSIVAGRDESAGAEEVVVVDVQRFDDARRELRRMTSVLIAFAGVLDLREKLRKVLTEACCQLESMIKQTVEAAACKEVEEALREVLRTVGGNVVREVLKLPEAVATMREKHSEQRKRLVEAQAEELSMLQRHSPQDELQAAQEQHAIKLQEESYRAEAAATAWTGHIDHAGIKLEQYDENLLAEEAATLWSKLGWSFERLCCETAPLDWKGKKLIDADCEVIAAIFRKSGATVNITTVFLSSNMIGDEGIIALVDSTAFGALPNLQKLYINSNRIGDYGLVEFCNAMTAGRLAMLSFLDFNSNQVADVGMTALAAAISKGAMDNLTTLYMHCNRISDVGLDAFVGALTPQVLAKLEKLWLYNNRIRNDGMLTLATALSKGMLVSLKSLQLEGNLAGVDVQKATLEALKSRTL